MNEAMNPCTCWTLNIDENQMAWLHFDTPDTGVNTLSQEALSQLNQALEDVEKQDIKGLIILSDKKYGFIVGADIEEFTHISTVDEAEQFMDNAKVVFERLENMPMPTLALIHGFCLGGGLELSLACDYRIAQDDASLGFPEVMLGIFPGFGGSVRSIRQVGVVAAMSMMLSGRAVHAKKAKVMGLVDDVVPKRHLKRAAVLTIQAALSSKDKQKRPWYTQLREQLMCSALGRKLVANTLRKKTKQRVREDHYPAPFALIDLWQVYGGNSAANQAQMLDQETKAVAKLMLFPQTRNLIRLFFLQDRLKSFGKSGQLEAQVRHVHVIGAGVMGGDIAVWCAMQGLKVTLQDQNINAVATAIKRASALFEKKLRQPRQQQAAQDLLIPDVAGDGIKQADLVIEAIIESLEIKQNLYQSIEPQMKEGALLASNTSGIPMDDLATVLQHPERFVGIHFFNPVAKMKLVEVVAGLKTDEVTLQKAFSFVTHIRRLPLPVKSSPGFLVNRILMPYLMEAMYMVDEGISIAVIDAAALNFGMPMGPIELADRVGLDVCLAVAHDLSGITQDKSPAFVEDWVKEGRLGLKSGHGFYHYKKGKRIKKHGQQGLQQKSDVADRLIYRIIHESMCCLKEGIVQDEDLLDAGMVFGTGFAPFRGGVMRYVAEEGKENINKKLAQLAKVYGERFKGGV